MATHRTYDQLPEQTHYRDDGCHVHSHCLTCPLPRCIYDGNTRQEIKGIKYHAMRELGAQGVGRQEIARRFGVSRRTVDRAVRAT